MSHKPLLDPDGQHVAHRNVALLTVSDGERLDRLLVEESVRGLVWKRLDARRALVDATAVRVLMGRLRALGVSCRVGELESGGSS